MYVARSIEMNFRVRDLKVPNKAHGSPGDGTLPYRTLLLPYTRGGSALFGNHILD